VTELPIPNPAGAATMSPNGITVGANVVGVPLMIWARLVYRGYFSGKAEKAESLTELLPDEFRVTDEPIASPPHTAAYEPPVVPRPRVHEDREDRGEVQR
jgi:hypothetical protein